MRQSRAVEIAVGVFVALGLAALLMLALRVANITAYVNDDGYHVSASFASVAGLRERAPVTVAGVRVGRVTAIEFDPRTFEAVVTMRIGERYKLPEDTLASVYTAGLLGEKYIALEPGGADEDLADGGRIQLTQSAVVLEQLIGQFIFNRPDGDGGGAGEADPFGDDGLPPGWAP
ncbi:outer membrane lipid asymmetry maintenance protein MlaD [Ectothiorhodospiraceae bacterium 2226]|nr:outer membrane lipid asymmetry maintenance protein MlaD [Ectothiorhodospiraceae bacterium 2226]